MWVAEMDVAPPGPVVRAVTEAMESGDTGYPAGTAYAEALAAFADKRWGWSGLAVERTAIVPDVMLGVVEMLRLVTGPGDPVVVNPPVYPPFYASPVTRTAVSSKPRSARTDGSTRTSWNAPSARRPPAAGAPRTCCAARTTPPAPCTPPTS
ncbi:hypothetical protein STENM223S_04928 [Streptomyces tendae]